MSASNKRFGILVFDVKVDRYTGRVPILGAIAQLVERFHGMEEVRGSIPLSSTNYDFRSVQKRINPDEPHCPHCLAFNESSFHEEEMTINYYFEQSE